RSDKAAVWRKRVEIERYIRHRSGQNAARGTAGEVAVQRVTVEHAPAVLVNELLKRDARRRQMDPRPLHTPAHRERAQAVAAAPSVSGEPGGPVLEDRADPVQRLHVVLERGTAEQPDLRHVRRTQTRLPALPLNRIDHRGLFAADVRARSPAEVERRNRT